jgi:predicted dehydrogenase
MRLRAALIGCGAMSRAWLTAAAGIEGLELVGLADLDRAKAESRAEEFGLRDAFLATNVEALLARTAPDILFDVAVPAARHQIVAAALAAGCHVLSEKPMAESLDAARDLIARAERAQRIHAVVQNRRYIESVRRIARAIGSGAIGAVSSIHADFFLAPHFGGFREEMDHVLLLDMAIHSFDAMRCMTGLDAEAVYCREWDPANSWYRQGSSAVALFDLEGGALFTYRGSWCSQGLGTSWECAWRIVGAKGSLLWDGHDDIRIAIAGSEREGLFVETTSVAVPALDPADEIGGHLGVMQNFIAAVRGGREPETTARDNIKSLAMALGAIRSAEQGRRVEIII